MVNTKLLKEKLEKSGLRTGFICKALKISRKTFYNRVNGVYPFRTPEVEKLCELLHITSLREKNDIFFSNQ